MPTIKGPIKITGGFNAQTFLEENAKDIKVKLPFSATGFKSSKTPKHADMSKIKFAEDKPVKEKQVKTKPVKKAKSKKK